MCNIIYSNYIIILISLSLFFYFYLPHILARTYKGVGNENNENA